VRIASAELVSLIGLLALSVELTHLTVPDVLGRATTTTQTMLGYDLPGPPTVARLLMAWRIDVLFGPLAVLLAAGYLLGVRRVRARGLPWSWARTAAWLAGCGVLLLATCSGLGRYAAAMFSAHVAAHMLISMLVPALLVLGGPVGLVRAALGETGPDEPPGPRDWLEALVRSRTLRVLTHPIVALLVFAGSPFLLYFTGLFDGAVRFHWADLAIDAWFLAAGYLFLWPVIGVDAAPRPMPNLARLGMLLAAMPADIVFGAALIGTHRVIGNGPASSNMYQALALPWVPDLLSDQRLAGLLALGIGELTLFVVLAALVSRWNAVDDGDDTSRRLVEALNAD
jgi:putative copper resistance protein D